MTAAVQQSMLSATEAQELTDRIRINVEQLWSLLLQAHEGKAWHALGYGSWSVYIDTEFDMGRQYAYRLLDQAKVIRAIEEVSPMGDTPRVSEREARDIKPHLEIVTDEIRERVAAGENGHEVVTDVIRRTRDESREHDDMVRRFTKGLDQFAVGWIYIKDIGHHAHRDEILSKSSEMTREAVEAFEAAYGKGQP